MAQARSKTEDFAESFKPAIQLGHPDPAQWETNFFATQLPETRSKTGQHAVLLAGAPEADTPSQDVMLVATPVAGFQPTFRQVEVVDKSKYTAFAVEGGLTEPGVFVLLLQVGQAKDGQAEAYVNSRFVPFATLPELTKGTGQSGLLQIELPRSGIVKLNVTIRPTPAGEPEFRTFKTEVLIDGLSAAQAQEIANRLNFKSSSLISVLGAEILAAMDLWPLPTADIAEMAVGLPQLQPRTKRIIALTLVAVGTVTGVTGGLLAVAGLGSVVSGSVGAAGVLIGGTGGILNIYVGLQQQNQGALPPPQPPPATERDNLI
ncbi:MAG: hypothetical protein QNJ16_14465 [Rhodobacter sp.]|nr:hypothetical protein [Rhodobacter sp.]